MLKAMMSNKNGKGPDTLFLGVTFANLNSMREGDPLLVRGDEVGIPFNIVIHAEKSETEHLNQFAAKGMIPQNRITPKPMCPDDNTDLKWAANHQDMYCPKCDRRFGVLPEHREAARNAAKDDGPK